MLYISYTNERLIFFSFFQWGKKIQIFFVVNFAVNYSKSISADLNFQNSLFKIKLMNI